MVDQGDKSEKIEEYFESARPTIFSDVVPVQTQPAHNSVINTLAPKQHALEMIGFSEPVEIRELPQGFRVLKIEYPLFEQQRLLESLENSGLARPLSMTPVIRNPQEKLGSIQTLITSPSSLGHLRLRSRADGLHLRLSMAANHTSVLFLQGAASGLCPELFAPGKQNISGNIDFNPDAAPLIPWAESQTTSSLPQSLTVPRLGFCSYAIFDINTRQPDLNWPELLKHLAVLSRSTDFSYCFDQIGNLVIIALNERAIGRLSLWSDSLKKITFTPPHLFLGKGEVTSSDEQNLVVAGYLPRAELERFHLMGQKAPDIYSTEKVLASIKGDRDETIVSLEQRSFAEGLVAIDVEKQVNFHVGGGPDRLIGYRDEFKQLVGALEEKEKTRLIFLEGEAGTGKSRLINDVSHTTSNVIKISIDPAGRNIAGFSLADFADQIGVHLREKLSVDRSDLPPSVVNLLEFAEKSENEKLMEANKYTETLCFYCLRTLEYLAEHLGACTVLLDDAHHIDRYSDGHLMNLIGELLESEQGHAKVVLMRRPEARYASIHQDNLQQRITDRKTVSLHKADGRPKLDFSEPELAEEYIFYSLPTEVRTNPNDGLNRMLGGWASELGAIASTPFELTSYLQEIVSDIPRYLLIQKDHVELTREGAEKISKIQGKDMVVYHLERMREQLAPDTLKLLQVFALIGQKVASEETLIEFMEAAFDFPPLATEGYLQELEEKGYLVGQDVILPIDDFSGDIYETHYSIWHENIRDIVLNYTMDQPTKEDLATRVYQTSLHTSLISDNQKFSILHYAANAKSREDSPFWNDYIAWGSRALEDADAYHLYGQGYAVASLILQDMELEQAKENTVVSSLLDMMDGYEVEPSMARFTIKSLLALVQNGYYLGQFSKVYQSIAIAEKIVERSPEVPVDLPQFFQLGFDTAYAQINKEKLKYFQEKLKSDGQNRQQQDLNTLKFAYRQGQYQQCQNVFETFPEDQLLPAEVERLKMRIDLENIINELGLAGIDGDAVLSGMDLSPEQLESVERLQKKLLQFKERLTSQDHHDSVPQRLNPVDELHVLDIEAQLSALSGQYDQSIRRFGESWRVAMQMDIPQEAVRAAKQKGDVEVFRALLSRPNAKSKLFYRQALKGAVYTYSEDGLKIADKFDDQTWKFYLTIQRLRANCLLLLTYDEKESINLRTEVEGLLQMGNQDMAFINQSPWTDFIPQQSVGEPNKSDYEVCYYISPLIVLFRRICEDHEYEKVPAITLPFEEKHVVQGSTLYALSLQNDNLQERARKSKALCLQWNIPEV